MPFYLGEIRMFGGDYAPEKWALCDGRTLPISEFDALFGLIGVTYGGDGQTTFNLPDLRGRVAAHRGRGPGISQDYKLGQKAGLEFVSLTEGEMPSHKHALLASEGPGTSSNPANNVIGSPPAVSLFKRERPGSKMPSSMVTTVGGGTPHPNRMPFLAVTYIICVDGAYPPRS